MGEGWRTPTRAEFEELLSSCKFDVEMDPDADVLENVTVVYGDGREVKLPVVHLSYDNLLTIQRGGKIIKVPTSDYAHITTKQDGSGLSMSKTSGNDQTYAYFWTSDIYIFTNKDTGTQTTVGPCYYYTNGSWIYAPELYSLSNDEEWTLIPSGSSALYAYPILPVRDKK